VVSRDLPDGQAFTPGRDVKELRQRVERLETEIAGLKKELAETPPKGVEEV
jgi:cell division septum initiation protein DivIVA